MALVPGEGIREGLELLSGRFFFSIAGLTSGSDKYPPHGFVFVPDQCDESTYQFGVFLGAKNSQSRPNKSLSVSNGQG